MSVSFYDFTHFYGENADVFARFFAVLLPKRQLFLPSCGKTASLRQQGKV